MPIPIPADCQAFVREQIEAGHYSSPAEMVHAGLILLEDHVATQQRKLAWLREAIREGIESGPATELDMEDIIRESRAAFEREQPGKRRDQPAA